MSRFGGRSGRGGVGRWVGGFGDEKQGGGVPMCTEHCRGLCSGMTWCSCHSRCRCVCGSSKENALVIQNRVN